MSTRILLLFFILLSILLISVALLFTAKPLHLAKVEKIRVENIQRNYRKTYLRQRNQHIAERSIRFAQKSMERLLEDNPIKFDKGSHLLENKSNTPRKNYRTLKNISEILNHLKSKAILEIKTYSNEGSKKVNLKLSQKRADQLKKYLKSHTNLVFISAIGYGKNSYPTNDKKKSLKITLKRIK